jgi:hypothetical protein
MICSGLFHTMTLKVSGPHSVEPSKAPTDIRPGDPDAALKFRQVRANEILGDVEQRAAYDHLLELARLEPESASEHTIVARGPGVRLRI